MAEVITQARLKHLLSYDSTTGEFRWVNPTSVRVHVGVIAGSPDNRGYVGMVVDYGRYRAHQLAWLYVYGNFPPQEVDHINGDKSDNRIVNLRLASRKQNMENQKLHGLNRSGYRGVGWNKAKGRWQAKVTHNNVCIHLGWFKVLEEAVAAAKGARDKLFTHHQTSHSS